MRKCGRRYIHSVYERPFDPLPEFRFYPDVIEVLLDGQPRELLVKEQVPERLVLTQTQIAQQITERQV